MICGRGRLPAAPLDAGKEAINHQRHGGGGVKYSVTPHHQVTSQGGVISHQRSGLTAVDLFGRAVCGERPRDRHSLCLRNGPTGKANLPSQKWYLEFKLI